MYRNRAQLVEGWTKNLVFLFHSPVWLAAFRSLEFLGILATAVITMAALIRGPVTAAAVCGPAAIILLAMFLRRIVRAHFSLAATALAFIGLPFFSYLLLRSVISYRSGRLAWKGREYPGAAAPS
jgi:hypothetical protein